MEEEERRLRRAARKATESFMKHSRETSGEIGTELAAILEAHGMIASDETYLQAIIDRMRRDHVNAEWALAEVSSELGARLAKADSDAMRDRAADIDDVAGEIALHLSGGERPLPEKLPRGSILIADELTPVDAARLDPRRVRGLALERGGPTSHASIIARSFGLPAVFGIPGLCETVSPDRPIVVDGDRGTVDPAPSKEKLRRTALRSREASARRPPAARAHRPRRHDARRCARARARQPRVHRGVCGAGALPCRWGRAVPLGVPLPALRPAAGPPSRSSVPPTRGSSRPPTATPSSSEPTTWAERRGSARRAERTPRWASGACATAWPLPSSSRPSSRRSASRRGKGTCGSCCRWSLPWAELREAKGQLEKAAKTVGLSRLPPLGIMVEVPSAALVADRLATEADFFSIGTNDLTQYALAVDRANPEVSDLYRPLHPAILRMIKFVVDAGSAHNRPVAVCGELAADPVGIAVLVGLGITEVSVTPVAIASVKDSLASVDSGRARALAARAIQAEDAAEVDKIFRGKS